MLSFLEMNGYNWDKQKTDFLESWNSQNILETSYVLHMNFFKMPDNFHTKL